MDTTASPEAAQRQPPPYSLFSVRSIGVAAFFGSPLAGGILLALNFRRLGRPARALLALLLSVLATGCLLAAGVFLPMLTGTHVAGVASGLAALSAGAVVAAARSLQQDDIIRHKLAGGTLAAWWKTGSVMSLCMAMILKTGSVLIGMLPVAPGTHVQISGNVEVWYSGDATERDARRLEGRLREAMFFGRANRSSILLNKEGGRFTVSFVVKEEAANNPKVVQAFRQLGAFLADGDFGRPLRIRLCDSMLECLKEMTIGARPTPPVAAPADGPD